MGQFFKFLFASCLGVLLAIGVLIGIGGLIFASFANQASKPKDISANSVLRLTFEDPIPELTNNIEPDPFTTDFQDSDVLGLHDITATIRQAAEDDNIKGILLEPGLTYNSGFSTTRALRDALEDFADSGKFVISHSKFYLLKTYYLASAGTEVHVNPAGIMEVRGFSAEVPFYKDMLDRLEVDPQVFYSGKFKSATEPFRRNDMSPENREQVREYLTDYYDVFLDDVSRTRTIDRAELKRTIDEYLAGNPEEALRYKLVDGVSYRTEVEDRMRELIGLDEDESVKTFSLKDYYRSNPPDRNYRARDKVAVIYAEGTIVDGEGANGSVGDQRYIKTIQKVAKDDRVQAIVLRVNSPGGSALASENIWHALTEARESGKPLVVSMGDYAASGGYYISAPADSIFAQPNTLTGSIGVFRVMPNLSQTFGEELGIDWDSVKVSDRAIGYSPFFDLTQAEQEYVQRETDAAYELFLSRVAEGRGMTRDDVHEVAQGRVWTGQRALDKGLVDKPGDLQRAIASAVKMAELEDYRVVDYPQVKDPFTQLLEELMGADANVKAKWLMKSQFPKLYPHYKTATELRDMHGVQARMPFEPTWN
jgi:protease-4